ncbi:MAG: sigma-70 family RNA polymerase sigma factor [Bacteroidota bacterium]
MLRFLRSKTVNLDDAKLLARFQRSERAEDLTPLFERYLELIYGVCLKYLGSAQRAEDAGMEIFEHLLKKLPGQEITNFRSWLQTVVRNHCLMQLRKEKRDPLRNSDELVMYSSPVMHLIDEYSEGEDVREAGLADCLAELNEVQRTCVRMFYLEEGHTYKSIAEQLQLEVGRVRSHIQNGRRNLRICIEQKVKTEEA